MCFSASVSQVWAIVIHSLLYAQSNTHARGLYECVSLYVWSGYAWNVIFKNGFFGFVYSKKNVSLIYSVGLCHSQCSVLSSLSQSELFSVHLGSLLPIHHARTRVLRSIWGPLTQSRQHSWRLSLISRARDTILFHSFGISGGYTSAVLMFMLVHSFRSIRTQSSCELICSDFNSFSSSWDFQPKKNTAAAAAATSNTVRWKVCCVAYVSHIALRQTREMFSECADRIWTKLNNIRSGRGSARETRTRRAHTNARASWRDVCLTIGSCYFGCSVLEIYRNWCDKWSLCDFFQILCERWLLRKS